MLLAECKSFIRQRLKRMTALGAIILATGGVAIAQDDEDNLNLDFHDGLNGWTVYTGAVHFLYSDGSSSNCNDQNGCNYIFGSNPTPGGQLSFEWTKPNGWNDNMGYFTKKSFSNGESYYSTTGVITGHDPGITYKYESDRNRVMLYNYPTGQIGQTQLTTGAYELYYDTYIDFDRYKNWYHNVNGGLTTAYPKCYPLKKSNARSCRLGAAGSHDSWNTEFQYSDNYKNKVNYAAAERLVYEFTKKAGQNRILIHYLAVCCAPGGSHYCSGRNQVSITAVYTSSNKSIDDIDDCESSTANYQNTWQKVGAGCGAGMSLSSFDMTCAFGHTSCSHQHTDAKNKCDRTGPMNNSKSSVVMSTSDYATRDNAKKGWKTLDYDISDLAEGTRIAICVTTNDCNYVNNGGNKPGGHGAYVYFTGEILEQGLTLKYCNDIMEASAPEGYAKYEWWKKGEANPVCVTTVSNNNTANVLPAAYQSSTFWGETGELMVKAYTDETSSCGSEISKPYSQNRIVMAFDSTKYACWGQALNIATKVDEASSHLDSNDPIIYTYYKVNDDTPVKSVSNSTGVTNYTITPYGDANGKKYVVDVWAETQGGCSSTPVSKTYYAMPEPDITFTAAPVCMYTEVKANVKINNYNDIVLPKDEDGNILDNNRINYELSIIPNGFSANPAVSTSELNSGNGAKNNISFGISYSDASENIPVTISSVNSKGCIVNKTFNYSFKPTPTIKLLNQLSFWDKGGKRAEQTLCADDTIGASFYSTTPGYFVVEKKNRLNASVNKTTGVMPAQTDVVVAGEHRYFPTIPADWQYEDGLKMFGDNNYYYEIRLYKENPTTNTNQCYDYYYVYLDVYSNTLSAIVGDPVCPGEKTWVEVSGLYVNNAGGVEKPNFVVVTPTSSGPEESIQNDVTASAGVVNSSAVRYSLPAIIAPSYYKVRAEKNKYGCKEELDLNSLASLPVPVLSYTAVVTGTSTNVPLSVVPNADGSHTVTIDPQCAGTSITVYINNDGTSLCAFDVKDNGSSVKSGNAQSGNSFSFEYTVPETTSEGSRTYDVAVSSTESGQMLCGFTDKLIFKSKPSTTINFVATPNTPDNLTTNGVGFPANEISLNKYCSGEEYYI